MRARRRVLVVDDDDTYRELIEAALGDEGYDVSGAPNGAAALEIGSTVEHVAAIEIGPAWHCPRQEPAVTGGRREVEDLLACCLN